MLEQNNVNKVVFCESDLPASEVLRFVANHGITILKLERIEPTLEDLFMEVTEK